MSPIYRDKWKDYVHRLGNSLTASNARTYTRWMKRNIARFDTSDYLMDNVFGMPLVNKKVLGLKDKNNGMNSSRIRGTQNENVRWG